MQMYNCRWCGLSLADKSSSKGQPSWQPSWHPTSKLWATTISYQTFCVLEIKWWCRNNPETFDGSLSSFLWGLCGLCWAELSCEIQPDTRRLVWRVTEESSFVSGGRLPMSPPSPRQPGWIMESLATCVKSIDGSWCAPTFFLWFFE
jgi:hypothetical protein